LVGNIPVSWSCLIYFKKKSPLITLIDRYLISQPFLWVFTKSPTAAIQSILHVLFLPTPFKLLSQTTFVSTSTSNSTPSASTSNANKTNQAQGPIDTSLLDMPEEVLVPGALYADCAVVVNLTVKLDNSNVQTQANDKVQPGAETSMNEEGSRRDVIELSDDGEYGGELAGRLVWEAYEAGLKVWERENPRSVEEVGERESEGRDLGKQMETGQKIEGHEVEKDVYL
jgi:hypothetical protein